MPGVSDADTFNIHWRLCAIIVFYFFPASVEVSSGMERLSGLSVKAESSSHCRWSGFTVRQTSSTLHVLLAWHAKCHGWLAGNLFLIFFFFFHFWQNRPVIIVFMKVKASLQWCLFKWLLLLFSPECIDSFMLVLIHSADTECSRRVWRVVPPLVSFHHTHTISISCLWVCQRHLRPQIF